MYTSKVPSDGWEEKRYEKISSWNSFKKLDPRKIQDLIGNMREGLKVDMMFLMFYYIYM